MCIIAGYSGKKRAAPILIEMLKKSEYIDGGLSTGIATIHEGKLYTRKVIGDVEALLQNTDALDLPGTTGIIHSRTENNYVEHAHPFTSNDEKMAIVLNGTTFGGGSDEFYALRNKIMNEFMDNGVKIKSAVPPKNPNKVYRTILKNGYTYHGAGEPYAHLIGEAVKNSPKETIKDDIAAATKRALETLPIDIISLNVHANLPDTITIGNVTRPMSVGFGDGETYLASCAFMLPEKIQESPVAFISPTTIAQVTPKGLEIRSTALVGARVEQITSKVTARVRADIERILGGKENDPQSIYAFPLYTEWDEMWQKPLVDTPFPYDGTRLKPVVPALYEGLWSFHKEGRLHSVIGKNGEYKITKFWIDL